MTELPTTLNLIGLSFDIAGALLVFFCTPKVDFNTYLYNKKDQDKIVRKARFKNRMMRLGIFLLVIGFSFQVCSIAIK